MIPKKKIRSLLAPLSFLLVAVFLGLTRSLVGNPWRLLWLLLLLLLLLL